MLSQGFYDAHSISVLDQQLLAVCYVSFFQVCFLCMFPKCSMHCMALSIWLFSTVSNASFSLAMPEVSNCFTNQSISGYGTTRGSAVCDSYYLFVWLPDSSWRPQVHHGIRAQDVRTFILLLLGGICTSEGIIRSD